MDIGQQILFFFSAIGAFNGLFLSAYFAFFIKNKNRSTYFLAALLFVVSVRVTKSVFLIFYEGISTHFIQVGLSACMLIGPFLYLYVKEATSTVKQKSYQWLWHVVPVIIGMTLIGIYYPYKEHRYLWMRTQSGYLCWFLFGQWFTYVLLSFMMLKSELKKLIFKRVELTNKQVWLITINTGVFIIWLAYFTTNYTSYIVGALSFSFVLYLSILFWILKRRKSDLFFEEPQKYTSKKITASEAETIIAQLNIIMQKEELHKKPEIKLKQLAEKLNISSHFLSQLLNDNLGKSFSQYINTWRVETAKKLIQNNDQFTLEAIGFEAGFSSKSSFYSTFKKVTGTTPSSFKKQIS
ncbi:hypothetical protein GCM10009117_05100 [Gangjinia marincola]|uniref:HTH araC/xylS-type domain-containing protein n=1 Tax=Gangjinia marincola TaxID=578463 RepID=A0ABP3XSN5_9FLAO